MKNLYRSAALVTFFSAFEHCLGFLYRMILSRILGSEGLGVYQTALSVYAVCVTLVSGGLPVSLTRIISGYRAKGDLQGERAAATAAFVISLSLSLPLLLLLFLFRGDVTALFPDERCGVLFYILLLALPFNGCYAILRGCFWGNKRFFAYSVIELAEKVASVTLGVLSLLFLPIAMQAESKVTFALFLSYLFSFLLGSICFLRTGGRLASPKRQLKRLFLSSAPITAMRTSSSLIGSLVSVLFPARLIAAGFTASTAMSALGTVYGMVVPVLLIPTNLVGSIALVLVPELSECFYKKQTEKLSAYLTKAMNATLLIAGCLIPFFIVCGESVGVLLFANAESGVLISRSALILLPMSVSLMATSMLNSLGCERQTLAVFLLGSVGMLACVFFLPQFLQEGALLVGMGCDYTVCALVSLLLLTKKTGKLKSGKYLLKLIFCVLPVIAAGLALKSFLVNAAGDFLILLFTFLLVGGLEVLLFQLFKLCDLKELFRHFFCGKRQKNPSPVLTTGAK